MAPDQAPSMSFVALVIAAVDWRLASAVILPRAVLATRLAPLSHMLMNGFFFNHGFDIRELLCNGRAAAGIGCLGVLSFFQSTLERCESRRHIPCCCAIFIAWTRFCDRTWGVSRVGGDA